MKAREVYDSSDGDLTKAYYAGLGRLGPVGLIALNLFRAQKCSARAKTYSPKYRDRAYDRKDWSIGLLCDALRAHANDLGITWGWGRDDSAPGFEWVLYVELPNVGQVSFHARTRKAGCPDYADSWDGSRESAARIIAFCDSLTEVSA